MLTHGCSISFVTLLGFQKLPAGLEIGSASNQAGVLNHYRTFFKEIQEQPSARTHSKTDRDILIWKQTWPNRFGRGLTSNWITKTLLSYNTVQQKSFCGSSARWRKGQYASMLCHRSDLRVSRTCNRLLMLSGKYGGVKLAHYGLVAPLTCHNWQIFKVPHDLYRQ